jgi:hypothetical protein
MTGKRPSSTGRRQKNARIQAMPPWMLPWLSLLVAVLAAGAPRAHAGDHGDTPLLIGTGNHHARLTDFFAFVRDDSLVLALTLDPTVPPEAQEYAFPAGVRFRFFVDNHSEVLFQDPEDLASLGGTIVSPDGIAPDVELQVKFHRDGRLQLGSEQLRPDVLRQVRVFAGLRDDPFIRAPRAGRNVAAIVLEAPLDFFLADQSTLLLWATAMLPDLRGSQQELAGRALRSQFPENEPLNTLPPHEHGRLLGVAPDVIVLDTRFPSRFPNGRALEDDVVDLVCLSPEAECRIFGQPGEGPQGPTTNDVPFLDAFPYLAPPQP